MTDDKDRRALHCILNRFYDPAMTEPGRIMSSSGSYKVPTDGDIDDYVEFIETLPLTSSPDIFHMHSNANISKDTFETNKLFASILLTQSTGGGGEDSGGGKSRTDIIDEVAEDIFSKLPPEFDMEMAELRYPLSWAESGNTILCQELERFNKLTICMKASLVNVRKALKGLIVMSEQLEKVSSGLFFGTVPGHWMSSSYPSLKKLAGYVSDLVARLAFFKKWLEDKPPVVYWISGLFFTQAFLTGTLQNYSRKYTIPIDVVGFDFKMMPKDSYANRPKDGAYIYGLFLEGAQWDKKAAVLDESSPKVLFANAPIMWLVPERQDDPPFLLRPEGLDGIYPCPCYKTSERRGVLSTTGHSTNFVMMVLIPISSKHTTSHWVQRGCALLCSLDD